MITISIKDQGAIEFEDFDNAMAFIREHPEMYEYDIEKLSMFSDEPFEGLLIAEEAIKHAFQCRGCGVQLGFTRRSDQHLMTIICPNCSTAHNIKVHDDAGASKS